MKKFLIHGFIIIVMLFIISCGKDTRKFTIISIEETGCGFCAKQKPILLELQKEYETKLKIIIYDIATQEGREKMYEYKVKRFPTQIFLDKNGKVFYKYPGLMQKDMILAVLKMKGF